MISEIDRAALYCCALDDIRGRLSVVQKICLGERTFSTKQFDYEVVATSIRKILEKIAFGSLIANHLAYEVFHKDIQKIWRAKRLLEGLEQIHQEFFPRPLMSPIVQPNQGYRHLHFNEVTTGFLSRAEFVELYDACSQVIHSQNPFSGTTSINFMRNPLDWADRIRQLLAFHSFRLAGYPQLWLGELEGPDGKAHVSIASPV